MRNGNSMVHGIPLHTAALYFSSKSTEAANLLIAGFGDWRIETFVARP